MAERNLGLLPVWVSRDEGEKHVHLWPICPLRHVDPFGVRWLPAERDMCWGQLFAECLSFDVDPRVPVRVYLGAGGVELDLRDAANPPLFQFAAGLIHIAGGRARR